MLEGKTYRTKIQPVVVKRRYFVCILYERGKAKIWVKLIHRQGFHLEYILVICKQMKITTNMGILNNTNN